MKPKTKMDKDDFWNGIMIIGIIAMFVAGGLALSEFMGAKSFCSSIEGKYSFQLAPPMHRCNNETIVEYSNGWSFVKQDYRNVTITYP